MSTPAAITDIPKTPAERRVWAKYQLELRGKTFKSVADSIGTSRQAVSQCFFAPSFHVQTALAETLGLTHRQLFPEYYNSDGVLLTRTIAPQRSPDRRRRHGDSVRAR